MKVLRIGPQDALPDLEPCYDGIFQFWCANTPGAVPWRLMKAQARQESMFNPIAVSMTGPLGLFQFTKLTWGEYSKPGEDRRDIFVATGAAVRMMANLTKWARQHGVVGDHVYRFALGSYNQGMGNIGKAMQWASNEGADPIDWGNIPTAFMDVLLKSGKPHDEAAARTAEVTAYVANIMRFWAAYENPVVDA